MERYLTTDDKNCRDKTDVLYNRQLNRSEGRDGTNAEEEEKKKKKVRRISSRVSVRRRNTNIRQTRDIARQGKRGTRDAMTSVAPASRYIDVITLIHARTSRLKRASLLSRYLHCTGTQFSLSLARQ